MGNSRRVSQDNKIFSMEHVELNEINWEDYDTSSPATMRKTRPIEIGNIVKFKTEEHGKTQRGIVLYMGAHCLHFRGEWCSWYRVIPQNKNGEWSKLWITVYDAMIQRAYD